MIRTLEELSLNAWPALQTQLYDGWVLRFANGYTRRANSINAIYPSAMESSLNPPLLRGTGGIEEKISACEEIYRAKNLRVVFKMTNAVFPENLDATLEARGYVAEATTSVQVCDLGAVAPTTNWDALMFESPTQDWVDDYCRLNAVAAQHKVTMTQMLASIAPARCFIALKAREQVIAVGLGVYENGFVGLFDLVTDEKYRRRGYGMQLILNLLNWGKRHGATRAYLQVMLSNTGAMRLYERLGFKEVYQYWYRVKNA